MNNREGLFSSRQPRAYRRRGMTLVEVLTAMFVLVVVFGAVLATVVHASSLTRDSKVVYRSTAIMNDLIERMRSMTFVKLKEELKDGSTALGISADSDGVAPLITHGEVPPETPSGAGTGPVLAGAYNYKWRRTCQTPTSDPLRIDIEIWPEGVERRKISAVIYISASGLINK